MMHPPAQPTLVQSAGNDGTVKQYKALLDDGQDYDAKKKQRLGL